MKISSKNLFVIANQLNKAIGKEKLPLEVNKIKMMQRRVEREKMKTNNMFEEKKKNHVQKPKKAITKSTIRNKARVQKFRK